MEISWAGQVGGWVGRTLDGGRGSSPKLFFFLHPEFVTGNGNMNLPSGEPITFQFMHNNSSALTMQMIDYE